MADADSNSNTFDKDNDGRFLFNSAYMNMVRINGIADQLEHCIDEMLHKDGNDVWLALHGALGMAHLCKNLSSELLQHSDDIVVIAPKEVSHG